jgi:hypothetical protein
VAIICLKPGEESELQIWQQPHTGETEGEPVQLAGGGRGDRPRLQQQLASTGVGGEGVQTAGCYSRQGGGEDAPHSFQDLTQKVAWRVSTPPPSSPPAPPLILRQTLLPVRTATVYFQLHLQKYDNKYFFSGFFLKGRHEVVGAVGLGAVCCCATLLSTWG